MSTIKRTSFSFTTESLIIFKDFKANFVQKYGKPKISDQEVFTRILHETNNLKYASKPKIEAHEVLSVKVGFWRRMEYLFFNNIKVKVTTVIHKGHNGNNTTLTPM